MKRALEVGFSLVCTYLWRHIGNTFGPKGRIAPFILLWKGETKNVFFCFFKQEPTHMLEIIVLFKETKRWQKNLTCLCSIIPLRQRLNFHQGHDPMGDWRDVKTVQIYVRKADVRNVWVGTAHIV